ncbi:hypothetical protein [Amycolatopsis cihanbeyliensis]|uniref:hypothetical protein n=1 Tax=Amycolatopsis cihanbeyliensis TaxID=1128664 RepID=UPI00114F2019|nr:hypothetical protein [Amycolatopsis cihanbeyliensis]
MALPIVWGIVYLFVQSPVFMIQLGGIASAVVLPAVVVAVWYLRQTETDPRLLSDKLFNGILVVSTVALTTTGGYSVVEVF